MKINRKNKKLLKQVIKQANKVKDKDIPALKLDLKKLEEKKSLLIDRFNDLVEKVSRSDRERVKDILNEQADDIAQEITECNTHVNVLQTKIEKKNNDQISLTMIQEALKDFDEVIELLTPYEKRKLMHYLIKNAILFEDRLELNVLGEPTAIINKKGRSFSSLRP